MTMRVLLGCRHRSVVAHVRRLRGGASVAPVLPLFLLLLLLLLLPSRHQLIEPHHHSSDNFVEGRCDALFVAALTTTTTRRPPHLQQRSRNSALLLLFSSTQQPAAVLAQGRNATDLIVGSNEDLVQQQQQEQIMDSSPVLQEQQTVVLQQDANDDDDDDDDGDGDGDGDGDAFFRRLRREWPLPLQYGLRDSGVLRFVVNVGSVVGARRTVLQDHPEAVPEYLRLSGLQLPLWMMRFHSSLLNQQLQQPAISLETLSYGPSKQQIVHLLQHKKTSAGTSTINNSTQKQQQRRRLVVFVHGGAWGSGFSALYRLVARPFLNSNTNDCSATATTTTTSVAVVGYRTYPTATALEQGRDVADAVRRVQLQQQGHQHSCTTYNDVTLIGHSSGAHVCALALLRGLLSSTANGTTTTAKVDRFVGIAGVYDIPSHYRYERGRGVERISPMSQACRDNKDGRNNAAAAATVLHQWRQHSPTYLVQKQQLQQQQQQPSHQRLPPTLLLHGDADTTVPHQSSRQLARALSAAENSDRCELQILPGVEHAETALHLMFGGPTRDRLWEWMDG